MAESEAMLGYGTRVFIESPDSPNDSPPTFLEMAEVFNATPPNAEVDDVEVTHNTSPNRTREYIAGLIEPGEASFEMNFIPGSVSDLTLQSLKISGTRVRTRYLFPNNVYWEFSATVKGYEPSVETADKMTATVTMKVSGDTATGTGAP